MKTEIDFCARKLFLPATTIAAEAGWGGVALIITLKAVGPAFAAWMDYVFAQPTRGVLIADPEHKQNPCKMSGLDHPRAVQVSSALKQWMGQHRFCDEWIGDNALATLFAALRFGHPLTWRQWDRRGRIFQLPEMFSSPPAYRIGDGSTPPETTAAHMKRYIAWQQRERKQRRATLQFRLGERKQPGEAACFTAAVFAGATYAALARVYPLEADTMRKAVNSFCDRAGLSLPAKDTPMAGLPLT